MKVIISPHLDDAMLSLGGNIFKWRAKKEKVKIINVFTISNWLKEGFQKHKTTSIRKQEENKICKITGAISIFLDFAETRLRGYSWKKFWQSNIDWDIDKKTFLDVKKEILKHIRKDQEIYFPLALGWHIDHQLINEIGEELFKSKKFKIYFYEDLHYAIKYPSRRYFVKKLKLKPKLINITKFIDKKIKLLKLYKSQLSLSKHIIPTRKYAFKFKPGKAYERIWG